ncbi:MAG: hypothetical protein CMP10_18080 [Zetaproteobacteria bacterium]|nr:hypothetical protein [Pseudobdellovibrionaceae bacterium]
MKEADVMKTTGIMKMAMMMVIWSMNISQALALPPIFGFCRDSDKDCLQELMDRSPTKSKRHWRKFAQKNLEDRIIAADGDGVKLLQLLNRFYGDSVRAIPSPAERVNPFLNDVRKAMTDIPPALKAKIKKKLMAIVLAEKTGSTATTIDLLHSGSSPDAAVIFLDVGALYDKTANQWASWKENTPFATDGAYKVKMTIAEPSYDNRIQAIQYILLHEIGHVLALNTSIHPLWFSEKKSPPQMADYPFMKLSWNYTNVGYQSLFDQNFPLRKDVRYYFGKDLPNEAIPKAYANLVKTNFVTLYGATSPYEDWAEVFVTYVHTKVMNKVFRLEIMQGDQVIQTLPVCWENDRCQGKDQILREFLGLGDEL